MLTLALNAAIMIWSVLLLLGPGLAVTLRRGLTAAMLAGTTTLTLVGICLITYLTALSGHGTIAPLRVCAVILALVLVWDAVTAVRLLRSRPPGNRFWAGNPDALVLPVGLLVATWMLAPPILALARSGQRFGLVTEGNGDLANYALAAGNVAEAGFRNTNHLAGLDLGDFSHHLSYMGPTALINLMTAATGLAGWQVTMASMGVAIFLSVIALWALVKAVWPTAGNVAAATVIIASLAALSSFLVGQFFLGGVFALASVATSLAGAVLLARPGGESRAPGVLTVAGGGALGVYSYGHLGLPIVIILPFFSVLVGLLWGRRTRRDLLTVAKWSGRAVLAALVLSAVAVPTAVSLVRAQSSVVAGWTMPAMGADAMVFWAPGIWRASSTTSVIATWSFATVVIGLGLVASWRRGLRHSVAVSAVVGVGCLAVSLGFVVIYGAERYQTWKMESFLLPLALAFCIPALGSIKIGQTRLGVGLVILAVGAVSLNPLLSWQYATGLQAAPTTAPAGAVLTQPGLVRLADSPELEKLSSVNIRLGSAFETMAAGSIVPTPVVIFSSTTYYVPRTNLSTCTLTRMDMLSPGETAYTDLGGGYVLLQRPSVCAVKK